jgi:hypothetical protein
LLNNKWYHQSREERSRSEQGNLLPEAIRWKNAIGDDADAGEVSLLLIIVQVLVGEGPGFFVA